PQEATIAKVRERLLLLGELCYQQRPVLREHLGPLCLRGLKKRQWSTAVIEGTDHSRLSRGMLLAIASRLSRELKKRCPENRIAIVLPPGKGGVIANLAVLLAGKVPVNINFTSGRAAIE